MTVSQLNVLMIVLFVLAAVFFVLAIVLYFLLDVKYAIGVITGFSARKGVAAIGAKQKTIKDLDPITDKLADRNKIPVKAPAVNNVAAPAPVAPSVNQAASSTTKVDELGQTTLLSNEASNFNYGETTQLSADEPSAPVAVGGFGETTDLSVLEPSAPNPSVSFAFVCVEEVRFTAGTSVI